MSVEKEIFFLHKQLNLCLIQRILIPSEQIIRNVHRQCMLNLYKENFKSVMLNPCHRKQAAYSFIKKEFIFEFSVARP